MSQYLTSFDPVGVRADRSPDCIEIEKRLAAARRKFKQALARENKLVSSGFEENLLLKMKARHIKEERKIT